MNGIQKQLILKKVSSFIKQNDEVGVVGVIYNPYLNKFIKITNLRILNKDIFSQFFNDKEKKKIVRISSHQCLVLSLKRYKANNEHDEVKEMWEIFAYTNNYDKNRTKLKYLTEIEKGTWIL